MYVFYIFSYISCVSHVLMMTLDVRVIRHALLDSEGILIGLPSNSAVSLRYHISGHDCCCCYLEKNVSAVA